ncbi:MAG: hypothetical protein ABI605_04585 [Rhizobacter sp.]
MSYVIHAWEAPVPATLGDADRILGDLLGGRASAKASKLPTLMKVLWERYPRDLETDSEDPVWSDNTLSQAHDGLPVLSLGIMTSHLDEVVPFVAHSAKALGIVVYDPQFGTAYLPSGAVLGNMPVAPVKGADEPLTDPKVLRALVAEMKPFMTSQGFKWEKEGKLSSFVRRFDGGWSSILPAVQQYGTRIPVLIEIHFDAIDAVVNRIVNPKGTGSHNALGASLGRILQRMEPEFAKTLHIDEPGKEFILTKMDEVSKLAAELVSILQRWILPLMQQAESIQYAWRSALAEHETGERPLLLGSAYSTVIAGRLLGDARYEELGRAKAAKLPAWQSGAYVTFIDQLRTVKPLAQ